MKKNTDMFDHEEVWNLDKSLAKYLWPRLRVLRKETECHPTELTFKEWKIILKKMEKAFKNYSNSLFQDDKRNSVELNEALDLLNKYFIHLWW